MPPPSRRTRNSMFTWLQCIEPRLHEAVSSDWLRVWFRLAAASLLRPTPYCLLSWEPCEDRPSRAEGSKVSPSCPLALGLLAVQAGGCSLLISAKPQPRPCPPMPGIRKMEYMFEEGMYFHESQLKHPPMMRDCPKGPSLPCLYIVQYRTFLSDGIISVNPSAIQVLSKWKSQWKQAAGTSVAAKVIGGRRSKLLRFQPAETLWAAGSAFTVHHGARCTPGNLAIASASN